MAEVAVVAVVLEPVSHIHQGEEPQQEAEANKEGGKTRASARRNGVDPIHLYRALDNMVC